MVVDGFVVVVDGFVVVVDVVVEVVVVVDDEVGRNLSQHSSLYFRPAHTRPAVGRLWTRSARKPFLFMTSHMLSKPHKSSLKVG